jgi:hypothetical protein
MDSIGVVPQIEGSILTDGVSASIAPRITAWMVLIADWAC